MDERYAQWAAQAALAARGLMDAAALAPGSLLVVGCSTSEILGADIGKGGSLPLAQALAQALVQVTAARGVALAAQCCEHLNRALVLPAAVAAAHGWDPVTVVPQPHAGGAFASAVWRLLEAPVAVESIRADAGMDIGDTLIGMHLRAVAVPVRLAIRRIGQANLVCARTRPKYIGGPRAVYTTDEA